MARATRLEYRNVTMRFADAAGRGVTAVAGVSLAVADGEVVALIGPSGCGKSTLLNIGAGLNAASEGAAFIDGEKVEGSNAHVAFMLQKDLLLPWRTVAENVMLGAEIQGQGREQRRRRASELLDGFGLGEFADHYPHQLSGGMRQRAALARTLAVDPSVLLLDEPFSAVDAQTRMVLQRDLARTLTRAGKTALLITHELTEAVTLSDRVLVMSARPGRIVDEMTIDLPQRDDPLARRRDPRVNDYVARLMDRLHRRRRARGGWRGRRPMSARRLRLPSGAGASFILFVIFLAAWEWGPGLLGIPTYIIPSLSEVAREAVRMWHLNHVLMHTGVTAGEVIAGFVLGSLLGAFIGYLLGMSPATEVALSPYSLALQIAPKVAFAPLFILWMGFSVYPKILVAVLIVFFPVMVNVLTAIRTVDPDLVNLARSFTATRAQIFWKIEFPASLPPLFAGLRIGSTLAVVGVVVGEFVGGNLGLGFLLTFGEGQADTPMVFVSIVLLTVIGSLAYLAVVFAERRVLHYLPAREYRL
jgi:ABC-type nitrate/sulfonate/bicarbonate transport system ATPase subunit/ABC-type nitrate/sulfonate/bicarbonate transport system permease component